MTSELQNTKGIKQQPWLINKEEINLTAEKIGGGAYGSVSIAVFRGTRVAAKCIHGLIISDFNKGVFIREMGIAATLHHPNIVQFIGAAGVDNPILLYELMLTSLHKHLEKTGHPMTRPQIIAVGCDIGLALSYIHLWKPHPIIHRDVSSPNVLMDPLPEGKWRYKLSDFGSANLQCHVKTKFPGNPGYAAYEAIDPNNHTPAMDVYSFAVLLMEVTLNCPPGTNCRLREEQTKTIKWGPMKTLVQQCIVENHTKRPTISCVLDTLRRMK